MGRHSFRIVDGRGIEVYRRVQAPRRDRRDRAAAFDTTKRITTGVPGLDEIVNGGYFVGSTTVVAGISGVGKSVMALQYLAEGVRRGERCLMLSLDEQVAQITRNASTIGIDLAPAIEEGLVRIHYDPPQEIEIDHHFHQIEQIMEEFKPVRVVFDNILLLNWVELGDHFRLALTVAKMRANPTSRVTHEVEIRDGQGMRVLPRPLTAAEAGSLAPFASYRGLVSRSPTRLREAAPPDGEN